MENQITINAERPRFPVGVNIFVLRDGKLLLGKRKNTAGAGSWGLPGGHLEYGEKAIDAGKRELKEETGLEVEMLTFLNIINDLRQDDQRLHLGFLAHGAVGEPILAEPEKCEEWAWFELAALPEPLFIGHIQQIQAFIENRAFGE